MARAERGDLGETEAERVRRIWYASFCQGDFKGNFGGSEEGGLNIGEHEGLSMQRIESKTQSHQRLLTTPMPLDPLGSL